VGEQDVEEGGEEEGDEDCLEEMHKARHGCELARWNNHSS
jgi:hypothetical protein